MVESNTAMHRSSRKVSSRYFLQGFVVNFLITFGELVGGAFIILLLLPIFLLWFFLVVCMMIMRAKADFVVMIYIMLGLVAVGVALVIAVAARFGRDTVEDRREEATNMMGDERRLGLLGILAREEGSPGSP
jgi:hypothetical protein